MNKLGLVGLKLSSSDVAKLSILPDLVRRAGTHGLTVDVHARLLPHVQPDDLASLRVDLTTHLVESDLQSGEGRLATAVDLVAGHPAEVWNPGNRIRQLLDLFKVVGHGDGLPYLGVLRHVGGGLP